MEKVINSGLLGFSPEQKKQYIAAVERNLKKVLDGADIYIRVPTNDVVEAIARGGFKTQFETGSSRGSYAPSHRAKVERDSFGYPPDTPITSRPIYGAIATPSVESTGASTAYGHIAIRLKPEVKVRATITGGDSFGSFSPSPANKPRVDSLVSEVYAALSPSASGRQVRESFERALNAKTTADLQGRIPSYIEAQIHGGVKASDISEITYYSQYGQHPSESVRSWAKANGIKLLVNNNEYNR